MKNSLLIMLIAVGLLFGQTPDQVKQAKDVVKSSGMSEAQGKAAAKAQGYTDQQIEAAAQKEKSTKSKDEEPESDEKPEDDEAAPEVPVTPTPVAPPRPDEDAMRSELKSLRQTAVSLTVGEKEGASALIKEWLEDNPNKKEEGEEAGEE